MAEQWNFHNYIAIPLESILCKNSGKDYTADEIEAGSFVEAMMSVLSADPGKILQYAYFFEKCSEFIGKGNQDIPDDDAKRLFETFKAIIKND